jgi:hypothetical protein
MLTGLIRKNAKTEPQLGFLFRAVQLLAHDRFNAFLGFLIGLDGFLGAIFGRFRWAAASTYSDSCLGGGAFGRFFCRAIGINDAREGWSAKH